MKIRYALLPMMVMLTGCATLTNGPYSKVTVNSNPARAIVKDEGKEVGVTPCTLRFSNHKERTLSIEKEGYETRYKIVTKRFLKRWWLNVFFWPGAVVDLADGSAWKLEPRDIDVELREVRTMEADKSARVYK